MIPTGQLSDVFVQVADTLVDDFDLIDFLQKLTEHAAAVSGADAVGLLLVDERGNLQFMAASHPDAEVLELFQLQNAEGPCLDCFNSREPVINADLSGASDRWPMFVPRAARAGYRSVHAFPMRLRERTIGALNLFGTGDVFFAPDDARVVQALADVATIAILQERSISRAELLTEQLQGALDSRVIIEQAKGAIAIREDVGVDEAFALLRRRARSSRRKLVDVAREALDGSPASSIDERQAPAAGQ